MGNRLSYQRNLFSGCTSQVSLLSWVKHPHTQRSQTPHTPHLETECLHSWIRAIPWFMALWLRGTTQLLPKELNLLLPKRGTLLLPCLPQGMSTQHQRHSLEWIKIMHAVCLQLEDSLASHGQPWDPTFPFLSFVVFYPAEVSGSNGWKATEREEQIHLRGWLSLRFLTRGLIA